MKLYLILGGLLMVFQGFSIDLQAACKCVNYKKNGTCIEYIC